jgi:hypothetical protein
MGIRGPKMGYFSRKEVHISEVILTILEGYYKTITKQEKPKQGEKKMPELSKLDKFVKASNVKNGDIILFLDGGQIKEMDFKEDNGTVKKQPVLEMKVKHNGDEKIYSPNKTTRDLLGKAWGTNTDAWIGKKGKVKLISQIVKGALKDVIVLDPVSEVEI